MPRSNRYAVRNRPEPSEFFAWEPVELEMSLSLHKRHRSQISFATLRSWIFSFCLWIEHPMASVPLPVAEIVLRSRGLPSGCPWLGIRRDISIFGHPEAILSKAGPTPVWVEYGLGKGNRLKSNVAAVDVLRWRKPPNVTLPAWSCLGLARGNYFIEQEIPRAKRWRHLVACPSACESLERSCCFVRTGKVESASWNQAPGQKTYRSGINLLRRAEQKAGLRVTAGAVQRN